VLYLIISQNPWCRLGKRISRRIALLLLALATGITLTYNWQYMTSSSGSIAVGEKIWIGNELKENSAILNKSGIQDGCGHALVA